MIKPVVMELITPNPAFICKFNLNLNVLIHALKLSQLFDEERVQQRVGVDVFQKREEASNERD
jgi:hypothetical protein